MKNKEKLEKGNKNHTSHFALHTSQNGITLIALIITIIVMLILVGVTINVSLNGGLFTKASEASKQMQVEAEKEELLSSVVAAIGYDGKVDLGDIELPTGWTGTNGTYTSPKGNTFTVTADGKITGGGNGGSTGGQTAPVVPEDLEKYILGADEEGRALIGENGIIDQSTFSFIDDLLTEDVDETETLGVEFLTVGQNEDQTKAFIYAKYDDKAYKIICDVTTFKSEKLEMIYEPKGTEGQTTTDGWTILYDKGTTAEAVSPTAMGSLSLGYSETATDSATKLTEAIESYNNAITLINDYCKELEDLPTNSNVRSVGASSETSEYYSDIPESCNSTYNGVGKKGDTLFEQDLVRMAYHGVLFAGTDYWMASRVARGI